MVAEVIDGMLAEGERYRDFWRSMLHGDHVPPDAWAMKKAWEKWGREGMGLCRAIGVPIARAGAWRGEVLTGAGMLGAKRSSLLRATGLEASRAP